MSVVLIAATILLASRLSTDQPKVDQDPYAKDKVTVWDKTTPSPTKPAPPKWLADSPPPEIEPDPFYCRPEAPFPNDNCITPPDSEDRAEAPAVGPRQVEREVRRIGLPPLQVAIQPEGSTLVNFETIFHTTAVPFERSVDILDSTVDLRGEPASYTWHHGDGTNQTTTTPGRLYPAMDVIHQYAKPGTVRARVDVTYQVTYRIDGGDWETLDTLITAPGPATALRVREARPVLTQ